VDEEDKDAAIMGSGREVVVDGDGLVTLCPDLSGYSRPVDGWGIRSGDAAVAPAKMQARDKLGDKCLFFSTMFSQGESMLSKL